LGAVVGGLAGKGVGEAVNPTEEAASGEIMLLKPLIIQMPVPRIAI
jgi:hypothetical protein